MRFFSAVIIALAALTDLAVAAPTGATDVEKRELVKRAAVTDGPSTGYATLNGG